MGTQSRKAVWREREGSLTEGEGRPSLGGPKHVCSSLRMGSFLREFFASIQPDPDARQIEWRKRVKDIQEGATRVVERRQMPNRYWGVWQDKPMNMAHEVKKADRNTSDIDSALKAMIAQDPKLGDTKELKDPLRTPYFERGQIVPWDARPQPTA